MDVRHVVAAVLFLVKGIVGILGDVRDFGRLEERLHQLMREASAMVFTWALERLDEELLKRRDAAALKVVKFRERTLVSTCGCITVRRRLYFDRGRGQYRFLLDEALGWRPGQRLTARMEELALELGTEMPFRRAAKILGYVAPGASATAVWGVARKAGERAVAEAEEGRKRVFERGEAPEGSRPARKVRIEADGVVVALQRTRKRHDEVKLVVAYAGKTAGPRRSLVNRRTVAGLVDGRRIWEEAAVEFGGTWDLGRVEEVHVGGDGAPWIREGAEMFNGEYHLDPFHLRRHLTEALAFSSATYKAVTAAIGWMDRAAAMELLQAAARASRGAIRRRVLNLRDYLAANWEGIKALPEEDRLGAIEGQARHTLARRMKRIGARWTPGGADRMGRLLGAKSNGELRRYLSRWQAARPGPAMASVPSNAGQITSESAEDIEAWLRAKMPALTGPHAGRPWIKHILREIASIQKIA